jgi:hypothetical protein
MSPDQKVLVLLVRPLDFSSVPVQQWILVTPSFKIKTECISLCVPGSSFTHKVINSEINSITSVYNIVSY